MQIRYPRCAAIDVAKKEIAVCVRTPGEEPGGRRSQVRKYKTFYGVLKEMCAWLTEWGVTHVAMEDAGIKIDSVASDVLGVSSRDDMIRALIDGERRGAVLATWPAECPALRSPTCQWP